MRKKSHGQRGIVESRAQLRTLASPVRQEILDTLESLGGEAAVAEIAAQLGRPADGVYYHLRQLTRSGLLEELPEGSDGKGRRYRTSATRGQQLSLRYRGGSGGNLESVDRVIAGLLRMAKRDFSRALRSGKAITEGPRRDLWASRSKGWVSADDVAEINRLLVRLNELMHQPRDGDRDRLISFAYVLAPVTARPLRRKS